MRLNLFLGGLVFTFLQDAVHFEIAEQCRAFVDDLHVKEFSLSVSHIFPASEAMVLLRYKMTGFQGKVQRVQIQGVMYYWGVLNGPN
jgi:hypothetical protein